MNLHDYFEAQKQISLEPAHKVELYEKIIHQTHAPVSIFARMSFYTKVALYTFVGLVFIASLYVPYFSSLFQQTDGVITTSLGGGATVQADYIAQIIETKWDIAIYNNGERVESKLFRAGDRLVLPAGAEIVFHVTTIAQAKVIGPAEFFVEKTDQWYTIQLISWQYAEVQSLSGTNDTDTESLGVHSSRVSIRPKQSTKVHFTYTENGAEAIIANQWDSELVIAQADDATKQELLGTHTTATVADTGDSILSGQIMSPVQVAKALVQAQHEVPVTKQLISGSQHENIKAILSAEFLAADIQNVTSTYLKGTKAEYDAAYTNLYNKINQIYIIMGISIPQNLSEARHTGSLKVIIGAIEDLITEMDHNFYTAASHQTRLKKVLGWLYALNDSAFGSASGSTLSNSGLVETLNFDDYTDLLGR